MKSKDIIDAYCTIRKTNSTIPDEVLDFMKESSLKALELTEPDGIRIDQNIPGYDTIVIPKPTKSKLLPELKMIAKLARATGRYETADWLDEQISNYEYFRKMYIAARE